MNVSRTPRMDADVVTLWPKLTCQSAPYCIYQIEVREGFDRDDLLHELAELETKALGHVKHGRFHTESET